jgi:Ser/Thr protein kinase RdoA (MazF antagonist)
MKEAIVRRILKAYGLRYRRILAPQKGYRNESWPIVLENGTMRNFIFYKSEPEILNRIKAADAVSNFLDERGLPTRRSLGKIIQLQTRQSLTYGALYNYLPGETIPWDAYTMERIKNLGGAMSGMHAELRQYHGELPSVIAEYRGIARRMQRYFKRADVERALRQKLNLDAAFPERLFRLLDIAEHLPAQALHMDFVRGNILFQDDTVVGILDFEKTAYGPRAFDVARTLAFLLVDCKHKDETKVRKYFLHSGYSKRGESSFTDTTVQGQSLLEDLLNLFLLYDLYKFLRHNPYEFLYQNEHFIRTRNLLVARAVIAYNESIDRVVTRGRTYGIFLEEAADFAE